MSKIVVSSLNIYPLKSTKAVSLSSMMVDSFGPQWDRRWMVVDKNGQFISQRRYPLMGQIISRPTDYGLSLTSHGFDDLIIDCRQLSEHKSVTIFNDTFDALDCGDEAAEWLSKVIAPECRLVYMANDFLRQIDTDFASSGTGVSFSDGFPFLLISEESLKAFNKGLVDKVSMQRFRPNIVVRGCEAFAEDDWQEIEIAGINFSVVKPCARCIIPAIDPDTGIKQTRILKRLRELRLRNGEVTFGQNLIHHSAGQLSVNDPVEIIR